MTNLVTSIPTILGAIGALGTAASGLVDASKGIFGGISNAGFGRIRDALEPFKTALQSVESDWTDALKANWVNGMPKNDQKAAAKSLIRLGLSSENAASMAAAGHVNPAELTAAMVAVEKGGDLTPAQVNVLGRFNGAIDAVMDGGFERADQEYRNAAKLLAGILSVLLALAAGAMVTLDAGKMNLWGYFTSDRSFEAFLIGVVAVPLAPVVKDLTSTLQAAVSAIKVTKA